MPHFFIALLTPQWPPALTYCPKYGVASFDIVWLSPTTWWRRLRSMAYASLCRQSLSLYKWACAIHWRPWLRLSIIGNDMLILYWPIVIWDKINMRDVTTTMPQLASCTLRQMRMHCNFSIIWVTASYNITRCKCMPMEYFIERHMSLSRHWFYADRKTELTQGISKTAEYSLYLASTDKCVVKPYIFLI